MLISSRPRDDNNRRYHPFSRPQPWKPPPRSNDHTHPRSGQSVPARPDHVPARRELPDPLNRENRHSSRLPEGQKHNDDFTGDILEARGPNVEDDLETEIVWLGDNLARLRLSDGTENPTAQKEYETEDDDDDEIEWLVTIGPSEMTPNSQTEDGEEELAQATSQHLDGLEQLLAEEAMRQARLFAR